MTTLAAFEWLGEGNNLRFILEGFSAREIRSFTNAPLERIEAIAHRFAEQERAP